MENEYTIIPEKIDSKDLFSKNSFSPSDYNSLDMQNKNFVLLRKLIHKPISGKEIGSKEYLRKSNKYFIRTRALTEDSYLLDYLSEGITPIRPQSFIDNKLKAGDILLCKDSNVGEVVILNRDLPNYSICGGLKILRAKKDKYYLFAFLKSEFFKNQILLMTSRGATMKHSKELWMDAKIPYPNQKNSQDIINSIERLVKLKIYKEAEFRRNYFKIITIIKNELDKNQKNKSFLYSFPTILDLKKELRLDAGLFCEDYKREQFRIKNYKYGTKNIFELGFYFKRGQNLQVSQIGRSIYSKRKKENFYKMVRPLNLSDFGTVGSYEYLGNQKDLQILENGEIVFSAEGTIGKFSVFMDIRDKTITNIHGITIFRKKKDEIESAFLGVFLGYLRKMKILDYISVGGQGGSLAQRYWRNIKIPLFPRPLKKDLARRYFFGVLKIDKEIREIKTKIDYYINSIIHNKKIEI